VVGETGIPPIGAIGKVSQLSTGVTAPGETTANLIGANVAGGAAGQSADLLNDLKVGHLIGTPPGYQVVAQMFGVLTGSLVGSVVYLHLIPDPATMLVTEEWPAPAVATWKVVAETLSNGLGAIPASALSAVVIGGLLGTTGAWVQHRFAPKWMPNIPAFDGDTRIDIDHHVPGQSGRKTARALPAESGAALPDRGRIRLDCRGESDGCRKGPARDCRGLATVYVCDALHPV
jgi:hypothetical protein